VQELTADHSLEEGVVDPARQVLEVARHHGAQAHPEPAGNDDARLGRAGARRGRGLRPLVLHGVHIPAPCESAKAAMVPESLSARHTMALARKTSVPPACEWSVRRASSKAAMPAASRPVTAWRSTTRR